MISVVNSRNHLRTRQYKSSANSSRKGSQKEHFPIHSMKPTLPYYQYYIKIVHEKKKENFQTNVSQEYKCKIPEQNISTSATKICLKTVYTITKGELLQECKADSAFKTSI